MYVNHVCLVPEIRTEHLRWELWVVINHQMSAGNQTWFFCRSGTAVNSKPSLASELAALAEDLSSVSRTHTNCL